MGTLKVIIRKRALHTIEKVAEWYNAEVNPRAARHFVDDVHDAVVRLSQSPLIGTLDENYSTKKVKFYSFLLHPKYRIVYRFTQKTLYVVALRATMKKCK
ncbi:MAG: type II toxin-antitoxin system RelE/ParE family toxin [Odoribacter sp.]|nr:type II toxin-antitoxin system RelE/ParE family toxin [Odoribacter sp.]